MSSDYFDDVDLVVPSSHQAAGEIQLNDPTHCRPVRQVVKPKAQEVASPPYSLESEQGVVACCLMDGLVALAVIPWMRKEHFYDLRLGSVFGVLLEMQTASQAVDLLTVTARLKSLEMLEACGGLSFLSSLLDAVPSAFNLPAYAETVRDCARRREVLKACRDTALRIENDHSCTADQVSEMLCASLARADTLQAAAEPTTVKAHLQDTLARYNAVASGTTTPGVYHGFQSAHSLYPLVRYGETVVIAGRPSSGKTSLALSMALNMAQIVPAGESVAIITLETPVQGMIDRSLANLGGIEPRKIQMFSDRDHRSLTVAAGRLARLPLIIEHGPWGLTDLLQRMSDLVTKHGVRILVIDYVELVEATRRNAPYRDQVTEVAKAIKRFTVKHGVAMILLAQLSRECEKENRRPRLSDLGESAAIEKEADVVWLLSKPKAELFEVPVVTMDTYLEKQRDGAIGRIQMRFEKMFYRYMDPIEEMAPENTTHT